MRKTSDLTVTDQFCGAGGSSLGAKAAGARVVLAMNHWKLAVETHNTNFPETLHDCVDISACDPRRYPRTDILITSPECFPAGTLILTKERLKPIEDIEVGELVFTHCNRWQAVTKVMHQEASTVIIQGRGHYGLAVTPTHPFWIRTSSYPWNQTLRMNVRMLSEMKWVAAGQLDNQSFWATPTTFGEMQLDIPPVGGRGAEFVPEFWWMIGRWLGDGSLRVRSSEERPQKRQKRSPRPWPALCEWCREVAAQNQRYPH